MIQDMVWAVRRSLRRKGVLETARLCGHHLYNLATSRAKETARAEQEEIKYDRLHDVETRAEALPRRVTVEDGSHDHGNRYGTILPGEFHDLFSRLHLPVEGRVFIDLGSGKGRVLLLASEYRFKSIIGVEYALELHRRAEDNVRRFKGEQKCRAFQTLHLDAAKFEFPIEPTLLYMANPFDATIMSKVIANIGASLEAHPRPFTILYVNPVETAVLRSAPFLTLVESRTSLVPRYELFRSAH